ncbi:MAG: tripartite tricarboxylate transporter substrate binding protein [Burkholderiales bacterium]|nr:tripartite tricarboxylate transporter substrate binding protein [Burkholderiales bacterium]
MAATLRQPIVIDNRGGAGGNIAAEVVAKAPPDGYTLLQANISHTISASLYDKLSYDVLKDFAPVTELATTPFMLVATAALGTFSLRDLIALAKSKPGELSYASSGYGGPSHLAGELFKLAAGLNIRHVPYKGGSLAARDVVSGQVNMLFATVASSRSLVETGRLRGLAVASLRRSPILPNLPTMAEAGLPGFTAGTWFGVAVPAGTPRDIVKRLHASFAGALSDDEVREPLLNQAFELVGSPPEVFAQFIAAEVAKWGKVVRSANIRAE